MSVRTFASGGSFSKYSHEFQTVTDAGEDLIYICDKCHLAINKEVLADTKSACPECGNKNLREEKAVEVGNIFKLMDKFSQPFNLTYKDSAGQNKIVLMGCMFLSLSCVTSVLTCLGLIMFYTHKNAKAVMTV